MVIADAYSAERKRLLQEFGCRLRGARERRGLSQEALARRADVHRTQIGALELGQRDPHVSMLLILADALAVPAADLFDGLPVPRERKPATNAKHSDSRAANELRELRVRSGLSQEELASRIGLDRTSITKLERSDANPRLATLRRLADGLGVSLGQVVEAIEGDEPCPARGDA